MALIPMQVVRELQVLSRSSLGPSALFDFADAMSGAAEFLQDDDPDMAAAAQHLLEGLQALAPS